VTAPALRKGASPVSLTRLRRRLEPSLHATGSLPTSSHCWLCENALSQSDCTSDGESAALAHLKRQAHLPGREDVTGQSIGQVARVLLATVSSGATT
jgi:hypothetical protein